MFQALFLLLAQNDPIVVLGALTIMAYMAYKIMPYILNSYWALGFIVLIGTSHSDLREPDAQFVIDFMMIGGLVAMAWLKISED